MGPVLHLPRLLLSVVCLALPGCLHEPLAEPARSPDEPLILPSWAQAEPRSDAFPKAARQRETIVLGASDAPDRQPGSNDRSGDASRSSTGNRFPANDTYGPYRPLYYRSMPQTYAAPGAGTSSPSTGNSRQPPIGSDWPAIPDHGPRFPFPTPVHP